MIKLNDHIIIPTIFPDRSSQVWKLQDGLIQESENHIIWEFEHEGEFIHLAQLCDLILWHCKVQSTVVLEMPYFPYARQDKKVSNDATFARSTFISLLRALPGIKEYRTLDVHSSLMEGSRFKNESPVSYIKAAIRAVGPTVIVFPDKGASVRYGDLFSAFQTAHCEKTRNQETGEITGMKVIGEVNPTDRVLIVDDICDGGRTFIEIAKMLPDVQDINLYTTHGIYSKGTQVLRDAGIKRIFNRKGEV